MPGIARLRRTVALAAAGVGLLAACSSAPQAEPASTLPTGSSETVAAPEPVIAEVEADLMVRALQSYCASECRRRTRYVYNTVFTATMAESAHRAMPPAVRAAIEAADGGFHLVTDAEADALFGPDGLVDEGDGILLNVGPVEPLTDRIVGIEVGGITGRAAGRGIVMQFEWDGDGWVPVTPEESGVTVTSWVA